MKKYSKQLIAVYSNSDYEPSLGVIHEGSTADFANPRGFIIKTLDDMTPSGYTSGYYPAVDSNAFRDLEGKVLTICDASFNDPKQCEAVKTLFKEALRNWYSGMNEQLKVSQQVADKSKGTEV